MTARVLIAGLVLAFVAACSGDDDGGPMLPPDGNVIVGEDLDGGRRDAGPPRDAGPFDGGTRDGGASDGGDVDGGDRDGGGADRDGGTRDGGDLCDVTAVASLSAADAVAEAAARDGTIVEVVGTATHTPYACTDQPCPKEDPCCNTCTANIVVDGVLRLAADPCYGPRVGCSGTECVQSCQPALLGVPDRFVGRLVDGTPPRLELFEVAPP